MASRQIQDVYEVRTYHQADNQDRGLVAPADLVSDTGRLSLGEQLRRPRTLLSFAISGLIVVYVSSRQELSLAQVWTHTREAQPPAVAPWRSVLLRHLLRACTPLATDASK